MPDTAVDTLYSNPDMPVTDFAFDGQVAAVFPDMICRSVPGYGAILSSLPLIAARYATDHSTLYDLGCSLGAAALALRRGVRHKKGCRIVAVDTSSAMLERCRKHVAEDGRHYPDGDEPAPVIVRKGDICTEPVTDASVVVLNFTLQFVPRHDRCALLARIASGMKKNGVLVLSEKLAYPGDAQAQQVLEALHLDFKKANGYSALEISRKREALSRVLVPESLDAHRRRLYESGFSKVIPWFVHFNFASFLAFI